MKGFVKGDRNLFQSFARIAGEGRGPNRATRGLGRMRALAHTSEPNPHGQYLTGTFSRTSETAPFNTFL